MSRPLRVLIIEDREDDVLLLRRALLRGGFEPEIEHVQTAEQLNRALLANRFQLVISDFSLPSFNAREALLMVRELAPETPFIVVSGTVGEEIAVDAMRAGAADYITKNNLLRLAPAIERELNDAEARAARLAERRESAAALRRSEQNFRALIDQLPVGVLVASDDQMVYANSCWLSYVGCTRLEELILLWPAQVIDPADLQPLLARLRDRSQQGRPQVSLETRLRSRTGEQIVIESTSIVLDFDGERATVMVSRNVTAEREFQRRLMFADRMVSMGTLAAGVAHEINNPLAYIQGNLDFAALLATTEADKLRDTAVQKDLAEALREAREGTARVRQIVRDLKAFSRPDDEMMGPIDVHQVLDSAAQMTSNEVRHRARLVKQYGKVPPVLANEARLGQVFINLLLNAAQAIEGSPDQNEIRVRTSTDDEGRAVISVRDTGTGMTPDVQARIFDPFFTSKPIGVGTGLGLAICHGIVTQLHGEILVESTPGQGSEFRIVLPPLHDPAQDEATAPGEPARTAAERRGLVLVVDDEPRIGNTIRRLLEAEHEVTVLGGGREAIEQIERGLRYDVILCDLMMPEASGMLVHQELTRSVPEQAERMIFLTGGAFTPEARDFLLRVKNLHVEKPFSPADLRALVRSRVG